MIILVANNDIEHHSAEHFCCLRVRQAQSTHHIESLLVGICPMKPVIIVCDSAQGLHMQLPAVHMVESFCHKMRPSVFLFQFAIAHLDTALFDQFGKRVFEAAIIVSLRNPNLSITRLHVSNPQILVTNSSPMPTFAAKKAKPVTNVPPIMPAEPRPPRAVSREYLRQLPAILAQQYATGNTAVADRNEKKPA